MDDKSHEDQGFFKKKTQDLLHGYETFGGEATLAI
jgi:hypothetical protein